MGIIRVGPPTELITKLAVEFNLENFIETGTFKGNTAAWASQYFQNVFTIEFFQELYQAAANKFQHLNNIKFIFGDSRIELSKLVERLENPSLFWLDAHWCGSSSSTYGEQDRCPLIEEINIINSSKVDNFIFIDDARFFMSVPGGPQQWPDITAVIKALNSGNSGRFIVITEDVIIAVPISAQTTVAQYSKEVYARDWAKRKKKSKSSKIERKIQLIFQNCKTLLES